MAQSKLHVVPHNEHWAIKREGNERVTSTHDTQQQAIDAARELAKNQDAIVIHRQDGKIRETITYSDGTNDSNGNGTEASSTSGSEVSVSDVMSVGSRVNWGAIFAGAVVAVTTYLTLCMLALAIGVTTVDDLSSKTFATGSVIVSIFILLASLFLGGLVTSMTTVGENKCEALTYGVLVWGAFTLILLGMGSVLGLGFGASMALGNLDAPKTASAEDFVQAGKKVDYSEEKSRKFYEAYQEGKVVVNKADVTTGAWITFAGMVLSILTAVAGSVTGAGPELVIRQIRGRRRIVPAN